MTEQVPAWLPTRNRLRRLGASPVHQLADPALAARLLGLPGGSLAPGSPGDVTLIDLEREVRVDPAAFHSKSRNTPFAGGRLRGAAAGTIVAGRPIELP